jgi:hypothetical protein
MFDVVIQSGGSSEKPRDRLQTRTDDLGDQLVALDRVLNHLAGSIAPLSEIEGGDEMVIARDTQHFGA